jgi:hypothetical protein
VLYALKSHSIAACADSSITYSRMFPAFTTENASGLPLLPAT